MLRSVRGQAAAELLIYFTAGLALMLLITSAIVVNTTQERIKGSRNSLDML